VFELKYLEKDKLEALYHLRISKNRDDPTAGGKILEMEQNLARDSKLRFNFICKMIMGTTKNTLVIFSDIKNEYGIKIYEYIKENSDKQVFYIDGGVNPIVRNDMKEEMENDDTGNTIIVASMNCFTEGIDIANMGNIFLIESTKSDTILAQLLGRGMRNHPNKDKTMMIDFVDDYRYGQGYYTDNYLYRHGKERQAIYKKRGFPCKAFPIVLNATSVPLI
jgi:superfamily II DNA or RNA helicase